MSYNVYKRGPKKGIPKTNRDRVIRYFEDGLGYVEVPNRSKYTAYAESDKVTRLDDKYFIGRNGAVRIGRNASNSFSFTDTYRVRVREWEEKNGLK